MVVKIMNAAEAVKTITNNSTLATDGFVGASFPEELALELEKRFIATGEPSSLTLVYGAGQGDGKERGLNHLGHKKLLKKVIGGHWGLVPKIQKLAIENEIAAYNLPQGVISHLFRDIAAGKPGVITHVGLNTFVDPRISGGRINEAAKEDIVELMNIHGREYLFYKTFPINFAFIRGTTADENGNITMEKEGVTLEMLSVAAACRNSGGIVIAQVERITKAGTLDPKNVRIPGIFVDIIVPASKPEYHMQTFSELYNPSYSGETKIPLDHIEQATLDERKIIGRRAAFELARGKITNLGIGMPESVSAVANEENLLDDFVLSVEAGAIGGVPASGLSFGCSVNPEAIISQPEQFDFYHGGGLDIAFLGLAQADAAGNINVSKFGSRIPGCGGFIDITQNAKKVIYCGTFTTGSLNTEICQGKLKIKTEGSQKKFIKQVEQITFSGKHALELDQKVLYITERAVFELTTSGMLLREIAPGIDLKTDILDQMEFTPILADEIKLMDERIFQNQKMKIKINEEA